MTTEPRLSAVVVHWRDEEALEGLLEAWPSLPEVELVVIDNSGTGTAEGHPQVLYVTPPTNLGFGGGANLGIQVSRGEWILILNPDVRPVEGALRALLDAISEHPTCDGLAPRLIGEDGSPQWKWQLRPLPRPTQLLCHTLWIDPVRGPEGEPPTGSRIEQPAAAALMLRRSALEAVGGFDPRFQPAWFEDVDLAARLNAAQRTFEYLPAATFVHGLGGSVSSLGYGPFLVAYYRNLERYLDVHAGTRWRWILRPFLVAGMFLRLLALPWRRPQRATSRGAAASGLLNVIRGALSGWRLTP
ncbi:MAG: glycosyltransferase family 2 protein [Thermoanaerobaculia bacterium]|nr:glycosyltransferase family 2 protein [Thermoanaerobaculia bacterium]